MQYIDIESMCPSRNIATHAAVNGATGQPNILKAVIKKQINYVF